jgi:hypothetical protein
MNRRDVILPHQVMPALDSARAEYLASVATGPTSFNDIWRSTQAITPKTTATGAAATTTTSYNNNIHHPRKLLQR